MAAIRQRFKCACCRRMKNFDQGHTWGHGEKDELAPECVDCWYALHCKILEYVGNSKWRLETTIIRYIMKWSPYWTEPRIEDELFELVKESKLEWFGSEEETVGPIMDGSEPLKYRVPKPGVKDNAIKLGA